MKLTNERGNAVIEFIAIGLFAQLLIFGFLIKIGTEFRSEIASQAIARQVLRSVQLNSNSDSGQMMAAKVAEVFGITPSDNEISVKDDCAKSGVIQVQAQVRGKKVLLRGFCAK